MNLGNIRDRLFSQVDWAPTQSADAKARVNEFINRAQNQLALEAPFLFWEDILHFVTLADFKGEEGLSAADTVRVNATDPWVIQRTLPTTTTDITAWDTTGLWNGRWFEITDGDSVVHRRQIRDVWTDGTTQYASLVKPWPNLTDTGMEYRIYTPDYPLPDDLIQVYSIRIVENNQNWPLDVMGQLEAEKFSLADAPSQVAAGVPRVAFRRGHQAPLSSPTEAPTVAAPGTTEWVGPEPTGEFSYAFTYVWGYRDQEERNAGPSGNVTSSTSSHREPIWESSPSPVTSSVVVADAAGGNTSALLITTPNIDQMLGFNEAGDTRLNRTGIRKRIYRRRHSVTSTSGNYAGLDNAATNGFRIESPDKYFLINEVAGNDTSWNDTGLFVPDYSRPLRKVHGYQSLAMYPRPDQRFVIDVRCLRRPPELVDDEDVPRIHEEAMEVLFFKALTLLYESMGNMPMADRSEKKYRDYLQTLTKRYGDLRYPAEPLQRRPARASRVSNTRKPWRRWYNLP